MPLLPASPKFATHIDVSAHLDGRRFRLTIDGEQFPWHITEDGVQIEVTDQGLPAITITIPAERVTVDHSIQGENA